MADETERLGAIIEVQYNGQQQIERYVADLERLGIVQGRAAEGFRTVWANAAAGVLPLRDAMRQINALLDQSPADSNRMLRRFDWAVEGNRRVRTLEASLGRVDTLFANIERRLSGGGGRAFAAANEIRGRVAEAAANQLGGTQRQQNLIGAGTASPQQVQEQRALQRNLTSNTQATDRLTRAIEAAARGERQRGGAPTLVDRPTIDSGRPLAQLESPAVIQARQAELRETQRLTAATEQLSRVIARAAASGREVGDAQFTAPGTIGTTTSNTVPLFNQINRELAVMDAEMKSILNSASAISAQQHRYSIQQGNAGRITGLLNQGGLLGGDYNDYLQGTVRRAQSGYVKYGEPGYGLLTEGTVNRQAARAMGPDALRLLGIDPQQLNSQRYVEAPGFAASRVTPATTEADAAIAALHRERQAFLQDASTAAAGLLPIGPEGRRSQISSLLAGSDLSRFSYQNRPAEAPARETIATEVSKALPDYAALAGRLLQGGATPDQLVEGGLATREQVDVALKRLAASAEAAAAAEQRNAAATNASTARQVGSGFNIVPPGQYRPSSAQQLIGYPDASTRYGASASYNSLNPPGRALVVRPDGSIVPPGSYNPNPGAGGPNFTRPYAGGYGGYGGYYPRYAIGSGGAAGGAGGGGGVPPGSNYNPAFGPSGGGGPGFFADFQKGFQGTKSYGEQLGQTFKFSVFYGAAYKILFAITQTFQAALNEAIEFETAMTELKLATGRTADEIGPLGDQLGQTAARAGFAPAEGVTAGARAIGLFGLTDASLQRQSTTALQSTQIASMLALGNKNRTFQDIQTDLAATTNAFGLGPQGQAYLGDLDAYFSRKFGIAPGSTLQPIAETAALGSSAGFTLEQQAAISATLQARTGQTPSAVAGLLSQLFSRTGDGTLSQVAGRYGIDASSQTLSKTIEQLAKVYQTAADPEKNQIAAAFGRGRSQNAAQLLLENFPGIKESAREAAGGASQGALRTQFEERLNNIGGILAQLGGQFKEFALLLGSSGLIDVFGAGAVALTKLLEALNGVLALFDALPGSVRQTLIALALLTAAFKTGAAQSVIGSAIASRVPYSIVGRAAPIAGGAASFYRSTGLLANPVPASAGLAALGAAGNTATQVGFRGAAAALGSSAVATLTNPVTLAIGGLLAIGSVKGSIDRFRQATDQARGIMSDFSAEGNFTPEALKSYASSLSGQADTVRGSVGGFTNAITFGLANNGAERMANSLDRSADFAADLARRLEEQEANAPRAAQSPLEFLDQESISTKFGDIATQGGNASTQLRFLSNAIFNMSVVARNARKDFDPKLFADTRASALKGSLPDVLAGAGSVLRNSYLGTGVDLSALDPADVAAQQYTSSGTDLANFFTEKASEGDVSSAVQAALKKRNIKFAGQLNNNRAGLVAGDVAQDLADSFLPEDVLPEERERLFALLRDAIKDNLLKAAANPRAALNRKTLSRAEATAAAGGLVQGLQSQLAGLSEVDFGGRERALSVQIRNLRRLNRKASGDEDVPAIMDQLDDLRRQQAENAIAEIESLRKAQQHDASSKADIRRIGARALRQEIRAAIRGGNADALVGILSNAGDYAVNQAREALRQALAVAQAAAEVQRTISTRNLQGVISQFTYTDTESTPEIKQLRGMLRSLRGVNSQDRKNDPFLTGNDANLSASLEDSDTAAQIAAARAAANAARSGGGVAAARAQVQAAAAELDAAEPGTVAYYQALQSYYEAQNGLSDAMRAYQNVLAQLRIDTTNPLKMANLAVREARRKLEQDLAAGKSAEVIAQDRLDVRNAETEAEATRFQQRLDRAQTADQLGRISHAAYIRYLDREKDRLESIKNRTFQQQQQLNQIDQALQDAANAMQGQFNLGDIKLPTPYEVRRAIQERAGGAAGAAVVNGRPDVNQTVEINIDGADTGEIRRVLNEILGANGRRSSTARRKVKS